MTKSNPSFKALKNFLPFGLLTLAAYVGLAQFRKINYEHKKNEPVIYKDQLKKFGISENDYQSKAAVSRDEEFEKMLKDVPIENWKNVRGPRAWEPSPDLEAIKKERAELQFKKPKS